MKPEPCDICQTEAKPLTPLLKREDGELIPTNSDVSGPDAHYCSVCALLVDWSRLAADYGLTLK